ncbi:hypothetical protein HZU38_04570 [Mycolicibacterium vanbaalenii]|jgi:hypothetical protein|uniref:hypothetical protein n=1 Tax=Mycolicibacterium TaxID=1866885 RepID=UPI001F3306F7|nr:MULTISPECIES: hypothetical protein [Mycolicibacterium]MDW5610225.1 hypothetical protein [Mycolicibacterium sp. D5.8-2]UJL29788.1 hypothetical protein HZU38_04570 [Mycolicibacterium vanbaalenii]WND57156.1 hypothetical protein QQA43_01705 [Mycolicibacterium vanbaalenii]
MPGIRTATRGLLSRRMSVADVVELALWLAIPYVTIGLAWAFFHVEEVRHLEDLLQTRLPAGGGMLAYLLVAALWPVHVLLPAVCVG